jgi:hypothetical protein
LTTSFRHNRHRKKKRKRHPDKMRSAPQAK